MIVGNTLGQTFGYRSNAVGNRPPALNNQSILAGFAPELTGFGRAIAGAARGAAGGGVGKVCSAQLAPNRRYLIHWLWAENRLAATVYSAQYTKQPI